MSIEEIKRHLGLIQKNDNLLISYYRRILNIDIDSIEMIGVLNKPIENPIQNLPDNASPEEIKKFINDIPNDLKKSVDDADEGVLATKSLCNLAREGLCLTSLIADRIAFLSKREPAPSPELKESYRYILKEIKENHYPVFQHQIKVCS